jgi:hypothetical protein
MKWFPHKGQHIASVGQNCFTVILIVFNVQCYFLIPVYFVKFWSGITSGTPHSCMDIEGVLENWSG